MTAALGLGLLIGVLLGLLGGGGSILAVPALVYGVGLPLAAAIPTSLLVVGVSSATALLPRLRQVRWRIAGIFGAAGALAAFTGTAVNRLLDPRVVLVGFALLMVAAAVRMLRKDVPEGGDCALPGGGINWRGCLPKPSAPAWPSVSSPVCSASVAGSSSSPPSCSSSACPWRSRSAPAWSSSC